MNFHTKLDIDASGMTPKGLLIPRIALTSATDASTIATPATSLMVYNTGTALAPAPLVFSNTCGIKSV